MFEREINQTIQTLAAEVLREQTFVPLLTIVEDERIPWRFKSFFTTEVQWWLHNEALARAANKRFEYSHPELTSLLSYLEQVQFRHARFERDDFLVVLDSAVKLTFNYICRPQTTLKWYIFRGEPVKPLREVMLRFGAFGDYEYFSTVFAEWVERKQSERTTFDAISSTEFERVIRRIDDQILLSCTVEDLLELMSPFFDFICADPALGVPIDALVIYFDDKNIKKLVDHLEVYRSQGHTHILRDEFVSVLDELLTASEGEPEADFSTVYQNDELDAVVRQHLTGDQLVSDAAAAVSVSATAGSGAPAATHTASAVANPASGNVAETVTTTPTLTVVEEELEDWSEEEGSQDQMTEDEDTVDGGLPTDLNLDSLRQHLSALQQESVASESETVPDAMQEPDMIIQEGSQDDLDDDPWPWETIAPEVTEAADPPAEETAIEPADISPIPIEEDDDEDEVMEETEIEIEDGVEYGVEHGDSVKPDTDQVGEPQPEFPPAQPENSIADDDEEDDDEEWLAEIQQHIPTSVLQAAPESVASAAAVVAVPSPGLAVTAEIAPQPVSAAQPQPPAAAVPGMSDVRTFIDGMLERKVIKKVFQRNRSEYESVLNRLNSAQNWKVASQILDELFVRNNVDPYSRTAIRFTDSVYGRYLSTNNRS